MQFPQGHKKVENSQPGLAPTSRGPHTPEAPRPRGASWENPGRAARTRGGRTPDSAPALRSGTRRPPAEGRGREAPGPPRRALRKTGTAPIAHRGPSPRGRAGSPPGRGPAPAPGLAPPSRFPRRIPGGCGGPVARRDLRAPRPQREAPARTSVGPAPTRAPRLRRVSALPAPRHLRARRLRRAPCRQLAISAPPLSAKEKSRPRCPGS